MKTLLTVAAYIVTTFAVQGTSHFAVNAGFYASQPIMRLEPIVPLGFTSMVIQGLIFAALFPAFRGERPVRNGVIFSLAIGAFLVSYIALGEAGKYAIPSIPAWVAVEASVGFVQFAVFGALLGLIHRRAAAPAVVPQAT